MKICATKEEFAELIRSCDKTFCDNCVLRTYCNGKIEELCNIETFNDTFPFPGYLYKGTGDSPSLKPPYTIECSNEAVEK